MYDGWVAHDPYLLFGDLSLRAARDLFYYGCKYRYHEISTLYRHIAGMAGWEYFEGPVILVALLYVYISSAAAASLVALHYYLNVKRKRRPIKRPPATRLRRMTATIKLFVNRFGNRDKEARKRLLSVADHSDKFIAVVCANSGRLVYANKALKAVLGWQEGGGRRHGNFTLSDLYPSWQHDAELASILQQASSNGSAKSETLMIDRQGRLLPVYQTLLAHKDDQGKVRHYTIVAQDLLTHRSDEKEHLAKLALRQTLEIQEIERKHLAQELHDGVGQSLYYVSLGLRTLDASIEGDQQRRLLESMQDQLDHAMTEIRSFAAQLRPNLLDHFGLAASIQNLINAYSSAYPELSFSFYQETQLRAEPEVEIQLYRFVQEAIHNTVKHASAKMLTISLMSHMKGWLKLQCTDDGIGIDKKHQISGLGLRHMEERIRSIGGQYQLITDRGQGTTHIVCVPLHAHSK